MRGCVDPSAEIGAEGSKGRVHALFHDIFEHHVDVHVEAPQRPDHLLLPFMITQMREPTHRSTSSEGSSWLGFVADAFEERHDCSDA